MKHLPAAISSRLASISFNAEDSTEQNSSTRRPSGKAVSTAIWSTLISKVDRERYASVTSPGSPPFNQNVTTNVARQFLSLVDKHFPKHHRYHKLFNRNNVKCSYSCKNNMASIISCRNAKVLAPAPEQASRTCNCRQPQNCSFHGHCLTECVVYKASVSAPNKPARPYCGLTEGPFKTRYNGHTRSAAGGRLSYQNTSGISKNNTWITRSNGVLPSAQHHMSVAHGGVASAFQKKNGDRLGWSINSVEQTGGDCIHLPPQGPPF